MIRMFLSLFVIFTSAFAKANNEINMEFGNCYGIGYYINNCKPFTCNFTLDVGALQKGTRVKVILNVQGQEENKCIYNYKTIVKQENSGDFEIPVRCALSENGKAALLTELDKYLKGDADVFLQSTENKTLKKECKLNM